MNENIIQRSWKYVRQQEKRHQEYQTVVHSLKTIPSNLIESERDERD